MHMRKSKLESYQEILETLAKKPLTIDKLSYETSTDCTLLNQRVDFLIKNGLVNERGSGERTMFAVSERGIAVLKALNLQLHLEKVKSTIMAVDRTAQITPIISKDNDKPQ